jgi:hypothetical protein
LDFFLPPTRFCLQLEGDDLYSTTPQSDLTIFFPFPYRTNQPQRIGKLSFTMEEAYGEFHLDDLLYGVGKTEAVPTLLYNVSSSLPRSPGLHSRSNSSVASYLPLRTQSSGMARFTIHDPVGPFQTGRVASAPAMPSISSTTDQLLGLSDGGCHMGRVPFEIVEQIVLNLSHDDAKRMRLVCKEFYHAVTAVLLKTFVVNFDANMCGLSSISGAFDDVAVRNDSNAGTAPDGCSNKERVKDQDVGSSAFKRFGPHIRKFGIVFEVNESK